MSIANELSCDVAAAVLAEGISPLAPSPKSLTALVLEFHTTLRRLTDAERRRRRAHLLEALPTPNGNAAVATGR